MKLAFTKADTRKGYLILVSPDHGIEGTDNRGRMELIDGIPLEQQAAHRLRCLLEHIESKDRIVPVSGFRSHEEQVRIWEDTMEKEGEAFTRKFVAQPGHSEHESGLAIDLAENRANIDFICPEFPADGICGQFRREAGTYGFMERYPAGKEKITGIGAEPWHFRYVGWPHAALIWQKGLTLEEYLDFLRTHTDMDRPYLFEAEGQKIHIVYVNMRDRETAWAELPEGAFYQVSGTNEGGIVVSWCEERPWQWRTEL